MPLHQFRIRIDGSDDARVTDFCKKFGGKCLLVHHVLPTGNPHYHAYIESKLSQGNFSNKIKSELEVKGGDYSNKSCAPDRVLEYLSYLFNTKKGNQSRTVYYEGFSVLDVKTFQESAKTIAEDFAHRMSQEKKTQFDLVMLVIDRLGKENCIHPEVIYDEVIEVMKLNRMVARPYHVRDMISSVMAYSGNSRAQATAKGIALKFFSPDRV